MKKFSASILTATTIALSVLISAPVFAADDNCVETTFFGTQCGEGGIMAILNTVVDIMTVGIGVLGVIGIVIAGTQYLTAGDKEDQVKKAKRRIFEIVIGLAAYALIYAILKWLLPSFPS